VSVSPRPEVHDPPASSLSHLAFPTRDDMVGHKSFKPISERQPNSIHDKALTFVDFLESTSTWNQNHVVAFRMLDFDDLSIHYLYPQEYYPSANDSVIAEVEKLFTLSKEDIRHGKFNRFTTGSAFSLYRALHDGLQTQQKTPSPPQVPTRPQRSSQPRIPIHQYNISESSGSSFMPSLSSMDIPSTNFTSEDKTETVTNVLVIT